MSVVSDISSMRSRAASNRLLLKLRQSLAARLGEQRSDSLDSNVSFYDLNELPYVSQMRSLLLILCASTFMLAPIAYMPLAQIQAAYDQKCFLYTDLSIRKTGTNDNTSATSDILAVDPVSTEWGPTYICDLTTFVPVSMSIFSIIVGMSTFTIWPTLMSLGRGGALMMTYAILALLGLGACATSIGYLQAGYRETCENLRQEVMNVKHDGYSCSSLNNAEILIQEVRPSQIAKNVHRVMIIAQIIHWILLGLMFSKVCISILTFMIIWFYINS